MSRRWYAPKAIGQTDMLHNVRRGLAPAAGHGLRLRPMHRTTIPATARRHTQVPPYKHRRTADKDCRAGPMCPAVVPHHTGCGTFSIDRVSGHHTSSLFTIPSYLNKRPPSTTRNGVGTAALRLTPWGLRHLRMALWDDGGFRAVRGAGVSLAAASDRGRCPLDPCDFLKKIE